MSSNVGSAGRDGSSQATPFRLFGSLRRVHRNETQERRNVVGVPPEGRRAKREHEATGESGSSTVSLVHMGRKEQAREEFPFHSVWHYSPGNVVNVAGCVGIKKGWHCSHVRSIRTNRETPRVFGGSKTRSLP